MFFKTQPLSSSGGVAFTTARSDYVGKLKTKSPLIMDIKHAYVSGSS